MQADFSLQISLDVLDLTIRPMYESATIRPEQRRCSSTAGAFSVKVASARFGQCSVLLEGKPALAPIRHSSTETRWDFSRLAGKIRF